MKFLSKSRFEVFFFLGFVALAIWGFVDRLSPIEIDLSQRLLSPSLQHWFGTDENGADLFRQTLQGTTLSLSVSVIVSTIGFVIGSFFGLVSGWKSDIRDQFFLGVSEIFQAFPGFLLALAILSFSGPSFGNLILALALSHWIGYFRLVRAEVLTLKTQEFVEAAKALGASDLKILFHHIFPLTLGPCLTHASYSAAGLVIAESGLSFLGLGLPMEISSWGQLIQRGRLYMEESPSLVLFPSLFLALMVLCFFLLGDSLQKQIKSKGI